MLTIDEIQFYLRDDSIPTSIIEKALERAKDYVAEITNNITIDELGNRINTLPDTPSLDDVYLHIVLKRLNADLRGSEGKDSETIGTVSQTFSKDLPIELKKVIAQYNKGVSL